MNFGLLLCSVLTLNEIWSGIPNMSESANRSVVRIVPKNLPTSKYYLVGFLLITGKQASKQA